MKRKNLRPDGFPTRSDVRQYSVGERFIAAAVEAVESMGADVLLTDAIILLQQAKDKVADFVEQE
jgi:hypothetical protein